MKQNHFLEHRHKHDSDLGTRETALCANNFEYIFVTSFHTKENNPARIQTKRFEES